MSNDVKPLPAYMVESWFIGLQREVKASTTAKVAERMGVSRPTLSILLNGLGEYGKGTASTARIEMRYRQAFERITCTYDGKQVDIEHCREKALGKAPNHNPMKMHHWQACQGCQYKPKPKAPPPVVVKRAPSKSGKQPDMPMAALDTKTLPLPEVGGPQVDLTVKEPSK